jgi:hypothetical protein
MLGLYALTHTSFWSVIIEDDTVIHFRTGDLMDRYVPNPPHTPRMTHITY